MKKFFSLLLLCIASVVFLSCEKEDDTTFSTDQIIGTWETTRLYVGGEWIDVPSFSDMYATMTFYEDGRYYGDNELFGSGWGTYTLSGRTLKTYFEGELFYTYTIKSLTDTAAEVTMAYRGANIAIRLRKQ
ncbi:MAG: hypothetical protein J6Q31_02585 [Alistipes sp.]|nr:hypothetical protein [Alistipes sp.]